MFCAVYWLYYDGSKDAAEYILLLYCCSDLHYNDGEKRHVPYIIVCLLFVSDSSACTLFRGDSGLGDGGAEKIILSKIMADIGILYWFSPGQLNSPHAEGVRI